MPSSSNIVCVIMDDTGFSNIAWDNADGLVPKKLRHHNLEWITRGALDFLDDCRPAEPFFLYMATTTYHGPGHGPSLHRCLPGSG